MRCHVVVRLGLDAVARPRVVSHTGQGVEIGLGRSRYWEVHVDVDQQGVAVLVAESDAYRRCDAHVAAEGVIECQTGDCRAVAGVESGFWAE